MPAPRRARAPRACCSSTPRTGSCCCAAATPPTPSQGRVVVHPRRRAGRGRGRDGRTRLPRAGRGDRAGARPPTTSGRSCTSGSPASASAAPTTARPRSSTSPGSSGTRSTRRLDAARGRERDRAPLVAARGAGAHHRAGLPGRPRRRCWPAPWRPRDPRPPAGRALRERPVGVRAGAAAQRLPARRGHRRGRPRRLRRARWSSPPSCCRRAAAARCPGSPTPSCSPSGPARRRTTRCSPARSPCRSSSCPPQEVDRCGLHVMNVRAMRQAVARLDPCPSYVLTDGFPVAGHAGAGARGVEGRPGRGLRRRGLRRREGDPGPDDGRAARALPGVRLRGAQGLRHAGAHGGDGRARPVPGAPLVLRQRARRRSAGARGGQTGQMERAAS